MRNHQLKRLALLAGACALAYWVLFRNKAQAAPQGSVTVGEPVTIWPGN